MHHQKEDPKVKSESEKDHPGTESESQSLDSMEGVGKGMKVSIMDPCFCVYTCMYVCMYVCM